MYPPGVRHDGRMAEEAVTATAQGPWALPIVVRVERGAEPTAAAVAEATATAVVRLLDDARSRDGEWSGQVQPWLDGRIRKVARRARGAKWDAVARLPGMTVDHAGAQVRALLPTPIDAVPAEIAKLQVAGLELEPGMPSPGRRGRLPIAVTPLAAMTPLKVAVQAAHAAQLARTAMGAADLERWRTAGFGVRLERPDRETWARLAETALVQVHDGGFTEVPPGTLTAVTLWPRAFS
jgi:peptidyl-tRNA hydrolase